MAERSFAEEVTRLRLGAGETFYGEGILAITKALLESGVGYVAGYQGAPISHLMDVLADAEDILSELGVRFEASASEAAAAAALAASVSYPIRGAVTFKSPVGINVASDALANLASGGVTGGALVIVGEDYGEGASIMQERSHAFATKSLLWLLDPRPDLSSIVRMVKHGFALSEASNTPVLLEVRIRSCHVTGSFVTADNVPPPMTVREALENPARDISRIALPPFTYAHEQEKIHQRLPAAIRYIQEHRLNERFGPNSGEMGIIVQGGMYNGVIRALERLGLSDVYGTCAVPLLVLNVTFPLVDDDISEFCSGKLHVLVVEEGYPAYIEDAIAALMHRSRAAVFIHGKDLFPKAGEMTGQVMHDGLRSFLRTYFASILPSQGRASNAPPVDEHAERLRTVVPVRPPGFCTGCPERPIFAAAKLIEQELGKHHIACDIGCHLFSINAPFELGSSTMGYGLGPASVSALNAADASRRSISFIGDGGFWHNGLSSSIGNAVFNQHDGVVVVVDNFYSAATGGQAIPSSRARNRSRSTNHSIARAVRGVGVNWVRQVDRTYDVALMRKTLKEALTTKEKGPKVIVASSECMLNRQRRERPLRAAARAAGQRVVQTRFGVDPDVCTGDHACIRLSGCPSLNVRTSDSPLRDDPVAYVDQNCVGCGHCGEVAEAAVLCPSFYHADVVDNPPLLERLLAMLRRRLISYLQRRRETRRLIFPLQH